GAAVTTTWKVYLVHNSALVSPLPVQPDVLTGVGQGQAAWLPQAQRWYADPAGFGQELVAGGPAAWATAPGGVAPKTQVALPPVTVTGITATTDQIRFHVDRTGVPVLVKTSYFPNWHAQGATGPWRAEPNLMVVVPTAHDVTLSYGSSGADKLGDVLTVAGLVAVVALLRRRTVQA
ncbi:MAG TPA: hypothetical protein VLZ77_16920, partial [Acidimicrobiales bacterium]|nr:hypothetical protein [Acidimicrobiales bacterium]